MRPSYGFAKHIPQGSGKTLAFVVPMMRHIMDQPPLESMDGPIAIIMCPTRELAIQIHLEIKKFAKPLGLRNVAVYGGAGVAAQIADLKRGAEIITCTPGRMIDILCANSGRVTNLTRCTYCVLDEADRMFDMGFAPQIMTIIDNMRPDRQTVMFSATFPRSVEMLAKKALTNPVEIIIGGRSTASGNVKQLIEVRDENTKFRRLLELLGKWYSTGNNILVFMDQQEVTLLSLPSSYIQKCARFRLHLFLRPLSQQNTYTHTHTDKSLILP